MIPQYLMTMKENPRLVRNCLGAFNNYENAIEADYEGCHVILKSALKSRNQKERLMDRHILESYQFKVRYPFASSLTYESICTLLFKAVQRSFEQGDPDYKVDVSVHDSTIVGETLSIELKIIVSLENPDVKGEIPISDPHFLRPGSPTLAESS